MKTKTPQRQIVATPETRYRSAAIDRSAIDEQSRVIPVSFSSETREVRRFDEILNAMVPEILLHTPESIDFEPVRNVGSVLRNHDPNQIIGEPLEVALNGKRGVAKLRIGTTPTANAAWDEILQRMLKGVSFGYDVTEFVRLFAGDVYEGIEGPAIVATRWRVIEITLTPIPADSTVGVGRSRTAKAAALKRSTKMAKQKAAAGKREAVSIHIGKGDVAQDVGATDYTDEKDRGVDADAEEEAEEEDIAGREVISDDDAEDEVDEDEVQVKGTRPSSPTGAPRSSAHSARTRESRQGVEQRARLAERDRITGIRKAVKTAGLDDAFAERCIERGLTVGRACELALREMENSDVGVVARGSRSRGLQVTADGNEKRMRHMAVNLSRNLGQRADDKGLLSPYIDLSPEDQKIERQPISLCRMGEEYLSMIGYPGARHMPREEIARTIFSRKATEFANRAAAGNVSASISNILANIQNKAMLKAYTKAQPTWRRWCKIGSTPDFKQAYRLRLSDFADMRQTDENGEIFDSQIGDEKEALTLAVYARRISLTWQMFVNDDLDALGSLPAKMGQAAARLPSRLVYTHLLANPTMGDGSALFVAGHSNLDNTATALGAATLKTAINDMRKQKSIQAPNDSEFVAEPIDVNPAILLVPPELEIAAKQIAFSPGDVTAQLSANVINVYRDIIREVVVESRLSTTGYSGQSTTAWYLIADPASIDNFEVTFLDGNEAPRTDTWEDFDRLAMQFRVYLPCTAKALDWRGLHKSVGA